MDLITLLVIAALCLALPPNRPFGFFGLAICFYLLYAYPTFFLITFSLLVTAALITLIVYYRRQHHERLSRLPAKRD